MSGIQSKEEIEFLRKKKISSRDESLKQQTKFIEEKLKELEIAQTMVKAIACSTASELVSALNEGRLTSKQITCAYCYRAAKFGCYEAFNLITEANFLQAMETAAECDKVRAQQKMKNWIFGEQFDMKKSLPPLYGIPISVKDTINMNNFATTVGITNRSSQIQRDGVIMEGLRGAGLIPFVRTNVAQLAMTYDSNNHLWGRSLNPWDKSRTPGGSSGGEGGLISVGGSPLGVGADIGGSIRIPCDFCGICGLKPHSNRLSFQGHAIYTRAMEGGKIHQTMGPLARCVEDLALWMKSALHQDFYGKNTDPYIKMHSFSDSLYRVGQDQRFKIGYVPTLNFIEASKTSQRAVLEAVEVLKKLNYELVKIEIPNQREIFAAVLKNFLGSGGLQSYQQMLGGEQLIAEYFAGEYLGTLDECCYKTLVQVQKKKQQRVGFLLQCMARMTCNQFLANCGAINQFRRGWVKYLKDQGISLVIAPGFACQALKTGQAGSLFGAVIYTSIWNALDVPSGSMPITVVRNQEEFYESKEKDDIHRCIKKSQIGSVGLPAGIQIVGLPYEQQKVLGLMKVIESQVKFNQIYPGPNSIY